MARINTKAVGSCSSSSLLRSVLLLNLSSSLLIWNSLLSWLFTILKHLTGLDKLFLTQSLNHSLGIAVRNRIESEVSGINLLIQSALNLTLGLN